MLKQSIKFKRSNIPWVQEIPEHWDTKKMKFLLKNIQTGTTPSTAKNEYFDGGINWYTPGDFKEQKNLTESERTVSEIALKEKQVKILSKGTVLIVGIGATTGKVAMLTESATFNQQITGLETNNLLHPEYLYYCLLINRDTILKIANYTTLPIINNQFITNFYSIVPPFEEQYIILNFLNEKTSEIDSLIADKEKLIELLEEKRQAIITEAVTKGLNPNVKMKDSGVEWIGEIPEHWNYVKLKRCFKVYNGKEINIELNSDDESGVDVYGSGGIFKRTDQYLYNKESVLFGRKGTIGKPIYVDNKFWTVDTMYYTKFYKGMFPKWFYYVLSVFPWEIHTTQTALPSVVGSDIENEFWGVPSYAEQKLIAEHLDRIISEIHETINEIKAQLVTLKDYRQSLIYEAVTGKIDVRDYKKVLS